MRSIIFVSLVVLASMAAVSGSDLTAYECFCLKVEIVYSAACSTGRQLLIAEESAVMERGSTPLGWPDFWTAINSTLLTVSCTDLSTANTQCQTIITSPSSVVSTTPTSGK